MLRKTITQEIVRLVLEQASRKKRPSNKEIAANVGISYQTILNLLKKINDGEYDFEDVVVYIPEKKGRKRILTGAKAARAKEILTSSTTATLDTARELLAAEGIHASRSTIHRMTKKVNISVQMVTPRPSVVFTQHHINQRFEFARIVDDIPDEL